MEIFTISIFTKVELVKSQYYNGKTIREMTRDKGDDNDDTGISYFGRIF